MCNSESLMNMLMKMNNKLEDILPRVMIIEDRLNKIESILSPSLSEIKSSTRDILDVVPSISDYESLTHTSDNSETSSDCVSLSQVGEETYSDKHGLVMTNSDMSELATNTGKLLGCQVAMFNIILLPSDLFLGQ